MARANRSVVNSKPNTFNSTWKTDNTSAGSSAANQIAIPLHISGSYNFTVYWGDGTSNVITSYNQPEVTHSYATAGTYNVTMSGYIKGFRFTNTGDRRKIINISQWGGLKLSSVGSQFYGCDALTLNNISDTPNLYAKNVLPGFSASMAVMFRSCSLLTSISRLDQWDTSQVQYMGQTFYQAYRFNQNIGSWNTGRVANMDNMFGLGLTTITHSFNNGGSPSIGNWDTSQVTTFSQMFLYTPNFNQPIGNWNVSSASIFDFMFYQANTTPSGAFNQDISNWDTGKATSMAGMLFNQNQFNQEIGKWNVSNVTNLSSFLGIGNSGTGSFNNNGSSSMKNWNTSKVTTLRAMFQRQPYFNQEVGLWDVSNVTDMAFFIAGGIDKAFNNAGSPSIGLWNTGKVTTMTSMLVGCRLFDQNVGAWNTSNVLTMDGVFYCSGTPGVFNNGGSSAINNWNTSKVTNMSGLFRNQALFNQPVNSWDTSKVTDMSNVFYSATGFNQPLSNWNVSSSTTVANFMFGKTFSDYSTANYDTLLIGWASRPVKPNISTNFGSIQYTAAASASRAILTSAPNNWTITDGGQV